MLHIASGLRTQTHLTSTAVDILIERRRLGQTKLDVSPSVVNKINATSPSNLGNFDYAHLRVPLPKDLEGSGIFFAQNNSMYPESYFLMVRSFQHCQLSMRMQNAGA